MRAENAAVNARRRQRRGWICTRGFLRGESEGEKRRIVRARVCIRAISRVTNLYGIVWFIGHKFNNGRPSVPREKGDERAAAGRKGWEELSADGEIYDAFVWVSASRTKSLSDDLPARYSMHQSSIRDARNGALENSCRENEMRVTQKRTFCKKSESIYN